MTEKATKYEVTTGETGSMLAIVAKAASEPSVDAEKMNRLLDAQFRLMDRQAEMTFNAALHDMVALIPRINMRGEVVIYPKNGGPPRLQSKYGKYEDLDRVIRPLMVEHGFSLRFNSEPDDKGAVMIGTLAHRGGHSVTAKLWLPYDHSGNKNDLQGVGSTRSYGMRYLAGMLLNIVFEGEDDDGQAAGRGATIDEEQVCTIEQLVAKAGADKAKFLGFIGADNIQNIQARDYGKAIKLLNQKIKAKK